jgi:phosphoserine aminotransferase
MGGLDYYINLSKQKSEKLYDAIDSSNGFYSSKMIDLAYRSRINSIFRIAGGNTDLEEKFIKEAERERIV